MPDYKLIENLIKTLQYELSTYLRILKIAEMKTDCLISNDMEALSEITKEENSMSEQTIKLNQIREQLLGKLCEEMDQDFKTITIEKLKEWVKEPYKKHFEEIQIKLSGVVAKLAMRNGMNQKLIENAIKTINFNMQLITSPQPAVSLYGKSGQEVSHNTKRSMLDVKF